LAPAGFPVAMGALLPGTCILRWATVTGVVLRRTCCTNAICSDQHVNKRLESNADKARAQQIDKVPLL
jgi:hypothetical protein